MKLKDLSLKSFTLDVLARLISLLGIEKVPNEAVTMFCHEILRDHYGDFTVDQLFDAARMYSAGSLPGVELFGRIDPPFVGKLMAAYKRHLIESGQLVSSYDSARQFTQTNQITERHQPCDWLDYLYDLRMKFDTKKLQPNTLFIPLPTYNWCVKKGFLNEDSWRRFEPSAIEAMNKRKRMQRPDFLSLQSGLPAASNSQTEARKMAVLDWLLVDYQPHVSHAGAVPVTKAEIEVLYGADNDLGLYD